MKGYVCALAVVLVVSLCSGCATHQHYRSYLMKAVSSEPSTPDMFRTELSNAIQIPAEIDFQVRLEELHLGFLHRDMVAKRETEPRKYYYEGLGGKEIWVLVTAYSLNPSDPLGLDEKRFARASNVKLDQESFAFVPLSDVESVVFSGNSKESYHLTFTVYEVNGFKYKKLLAQAAGKGMVRGALDAAKGLLESTSNAFVSELVAKGEDAMKEPLAIERLLIGSGGTKEFVASVDLNRDARAAQQWPMRYAFLDKTKVLDPALKRGLNRSKEAAAAKGEAETSAAVEGIGAPAKYEDYLEALRLKHQGTERLATQSEVLALLKDKTGNKDDIENLLKAPYLKFVIEKVNPDDTAKGITSTPQGFQNIVVTLEGEKKEAKTKREMDEAATLLKSYAAPSADNGGTKEPAAAVTVAAGKTGNDQKTEGDDKTLTPVEAIQKDISENFNQANPVVPQALASLNGTTDKDAATSKLIETTAEGLRKLQERDHAEKDVLASRHLEAVALLQAQREEVTGGRVEQAARLVNYLSGVKDGQDMKTIKDTIVKSFDVTNMAVVKVLARAANGNAKIADLRQDANDMLERMKICQREEKKEHLMRILDRLRTLEAAEEKAIQAQIDEANRLAEYLTGLKKDGRELSAQTRDHIADIFEPSNPAVISVLASDGAGDRAVEVVEESIARLNTQKDEQKKRFAGYLRALQPEPAEVTKPKEGLEKAAVGQQETPAPAMVISIPSAGALEAREEQKTREAAPTSAQEKAAEQIRLNVLPVR